MLLDIVEPSLQQEIEQESLIGKTPHGIARLDYHKEMNMKNIIKIGTLAFMASAILAPSSATAQDWRRDKTANEWKTIATISGALSVLGALNHDDTLTFAGAAGAKGLFQHPFTVYLYYQHPVGCLGFGRFGVFHERFERQNGTLCTSVTVFRFGTNDKIDGFLKLGCMRACF